MNAVKKLRQRIYNAFKPLLLTKADYWFPAPVVRWCVRATYLSRFSRWLRENPCPVSFPKRVQLYEHLMNTEELDAPIDYLEFGVREGASMKWWLAHLEHPEARFFGFDTFTGLPDNWGVIPAGAFSTGGTLPDLIDPRCEFEVGLFQETLHSFLRKYPLVRRKVVTLDADLYSSTLFVLATLAPSLRSKDILIFDELGSTRMPDHEFRALDDFLAVFRIQLEPLGAAKYYAQMAFKVR